MLLDDAHVEPLAEVAVPGEADALGTTFGAELGNWLARAGGAAGVLEHAVDDGAGAPAVLADAAGVRAQDAERLGQVGEGVLREAGRRAVRPSSISVVRPTDSSGEVDDEAERVAQLVGDAGDHAAQGGELGFHDQPHAGDRLRLQATVEGGVLDGDGGLAGEGEEDVQVVLGEDGPRAEVVDVEQPDQIVARLGAARTSTRADALQGQTDRAASRRGSATAFGEERGHVLAEDVLDDVLAVERLLPPGPAARCGRRGG